MLPKDGCIQNLDAGDTIFDEKDARARLLEFRYRRTVFTGLVTCRRGRFLKLRWSTPAKSRDMNRIEVPS